MGYDPYAAYAKRKGAKVPTTKTSRGPGRAGAIQAATPPPPTRTTAPTPGRAGAIQARYTAPPPNQTLVGGHSGIGDVPARRSTAPLTTPIPQAPPTTRTAPTTPTTVRPDRQLANDTQAQVEAPAAAAPVYDDSLSGFTEADIAASLAAIEAEYGLTREELLRDQTMIGAQYRLLTAQLSRQRQLALEGAEAGALQRGLFRSGIFAAEAGQVEGQFGEAQAQLAQETLGKEGEIISQLETLDARSANAQAQEETRIRRKEYEARLAAAGL